MQVRPLSPGLAEKARVELNEDPKKVQDGLQHIKDWIAKQPHLKARTDDQWLLAFLRGCKFSLERTKEKLDLYYTLRTTAPELYRVTPSQPIFKEIIDLETFVILPKAVGPDGPIIAIVRPGRYDPAQFSATDIFAVSKLIEKIILIESDNGIVAGLHAVLDLEGATMGHFMQVTPILMKKMVVSIQDAVPVRLKSSHFINTPNGFETAFNMMKTFLSEKNGNRLHTHGKNYDELYKHIPQKLFPAEYGGQAGTMKEISEYWKKKIQEYSSWLEEDLQYGTVESKRPGKPKTAEDTFGAEGSFRQLNFD